MQWVVEVAVSSRLKRPGSEAEYSTQSKAKVTKPYSVAVRPPPRISLCNSDQLQDWSKFISLYSCNKMSSQTANDQIKQYEKI
jgi:hypothetical protein